MCFAKYSVKPSNERRRNTLCLRKIIYTSADHLPVAKSSGFDLKPSEMASFPENGLQN